MTAEELQDQIDEFVERKCFNATDHSDVNDAVCALTTVVRVLIKAANAAALETIQWSDVE